MPGTAFSTSNWTGYDEQSVTNPGSALTDFTLLIDVSTLSATWKSEVQSDGADIRVTKGDDTELAYDLIDWAYNAGAPTGWIRCKWSGTLAASGTQNVRVWAGYTGGTATAYNATETYGSDNAYDSSWAGYWPSHESSGNLFDRTSNGNSLTPTNTPTQGATGKVGKCVDYEGSSSQFAIGTSAVADAPFTLMVWGKPESFNGSHNRMIGIEKSTGTTYRAALGLFSSGATLRYNPNDGTNYLVDNTISASTGTWYHFAATESGSAQTTYLDGSAQSTTGSNTLDWSSNNMDSFLLADIGVTSSDYFDGLLDDAQLHSAVRSADWIAEEHAQSNSQSTFWGAWAWTAAGSGTSIPVFMHHYLQMRGA